MSNVFPLMQLFSLVILIVTNINLINSVATLKLIDAWRKLHPRSREYSWFNSDFTLASRLDKFFVSSKMLFSIRSCEITPCCFSDHDYVNLYLKFDRAQLRGLVFGNSMLPFYRIMSFVLSLKTESPTCR